MTGPASGGDAGELIDLAASYWKRMFSMLGDTRGVDGYTVARDVDSWIAASATFAAQLADRFSLSGGSELPVEVKDATTWVSKMTVLPSVTQRPLTLRSRGLRAIGLGPALHVLPPQVTFAPPVLQKGDTEFSVTVTLADSGQTLLYEGDIVADETNAPVTDPIRANNRDGGAAP